MASTFADLHCGEDHSHEHDHEHDTRIEGYLFIGIISALTVLLGVWCLFKLVSENYKAKEAEMNSGLSISLLTFFILCIVCSCLRVPVLYSLCNKPGTASVILYIVYASTYKVQWVLMVAVLFSRLFIISGYASDGQMRLSSIKCEAVLVSFALFVAFTSWVVNCVRLIIHSDELDDMNWFLGALSIGALIACCKLLSIAFIRILRKLSGADIAEQEFFDLATKLTILSSLSALSSALMCVCVVIVGLLSRDMNDSLMFWWFSGEAIDVAGNCLAMFLAIKIGSSPYRCLCGPMHSCCKGMFNLKKGAAQQRTPTNVELAIAECIAADAAQTITAAAAPAPPKLTTTTQNQEVHVRVDEIAKKSDAPGARKSCLYYAATNTKPAMVIHSAPP